MWRRNSLSLASKLARLNSNPSPFLLLRTSQHHGPLSRSNSTSPPDPVICSQSRPDVRFIATRAACDSAVDLPAAAAASASAGKGKEVAELVRHYSRCYWELSKARLSMLVVATSGTGYILGSGSSIDYLGLCCTCAGTMMVAAAANSLNQVFEVKNDAMMKRTRLRPLPSGRITRPHAVMWASSMGLAGTALLACETNMLAAGLAASNLVLYAFVYTPLKQIHPVNTWVGAIVGAIPPLLGWAAASGQISLNSMVLPAALYFWQLPHFMALAYLCRKDYADGGFKMFSLADPSGYRTAWVALRNCLYLLPLGYLAYDWGIASGWFCVESTLLALAISSTAGLFLVNRTTKNARRMFHASLLYLPVFMGGLLVHRRYDRELSLAVENSNQLAESTLSSSLDGELTESSSPRKNRRPAPSRAPVAYASVAPFPFLPAPYVSD
ncbi:protoheme IX farnesyltransferase, mitochondrial-like [Salvia hispanica]|uniref:protoheme IX farnesyltransferase, mitochondrial-like n=1 Tax=Salvia hispanica TaxID=49212 RepID=UPI00200987A3|nr:protoheme IX farnesyltransferase, mitochondrial-like [Salvia hispanica]